VAAIPTTLSGAPFTPFHRMPAGFDGFRLVRPALAVCEPALMASAPMPGLAATAMNALAHAAESLYAPGANAVAAAAGLRGAAVLADALGRDEPNRLGLALGSLLGGYAIGTTGFWVHHATCQTIVRTAGSPHAETNAVMLGHSLRFMASRTPAPVGDLALALGAPSSDPELAGDRAAELGARTGVTGLGALGVDAGAVPAIARAAAEHPVFAAAPSPPSERELRALLAAAL
jgi:alcohol dehydrogenase class IV